MMAKVKPSSLIGVKKKKDVVKKKISIKKSVSSLADRMFK